MLRQSNQVVQGLRDGNLILQSEPKGASKKHMQKISSCSSSLVFLEYAELFQEGEDRQKQVLLTPGSAHYNMLSNTLRQACPRAEAVELAFFGSPVHLSD